jgi:hypothetical protein
MRLTALALALALAACGVGTTSPDEFHRDYPYAETLVLEPRALAAGLSAIEHDVGGGHEIRAIGLSAHADFLELSVQDPRRPTHIDSYRWQDGYLRGPSPVRNPGDVSAQLFTLAEVPPDLYTYAAKAIDASRAKVEDGYVSAVSVERANRGLVVRINVQGPRDSDVEAFGVGATTPSPSPVQVDPARLPEPPR